MGVLMFKVSYLPEDMSGQNRLSQPTMPKNRKKYEVNFKTKLRIIVNLFRKVVKFKSKFK
jgi:hypothetical protein